MATNENVNKVIYGNQTVMDITDTTAEESDVASGEVFYKADGSRSVGTLNADSAVWGNISGTLSDQTDLQIELNRAYTKTASETSSIDDLDLIPVQKISASSDGRRNIKFRNLKSVLKTYFDNIYSTFSGSFNDLTDKPTVDQTYSATSSNAQSGKAVAEVVEQIYADNGVLGAKNLIDKNGKKNVAGGDASCEITSTGLRVYTESAGTYKYVDNVINLPKNRDVRLKTNVTITSGVGLIIVKYSDDGSTYSNLAVGTEIISSGEQVLSFNTGNHPYYSIAFFCTRTTSATGNVTYSDIMAYLASDPDDTYVPYAMTNKELTDKKFDRVEQRVLGAKNFFDYTLEKLKTYNTSGTWNNNIYTIRGISFTINSNLSITIDGTQDGTDYGSDLYLCSPNSATGRLPVSLIEGKKICAGEPIDSSIIRYGVWYYDTSKTYLNKQQSMENGEDELVINIPSDAVYFTQYLRINSTKSISNFTIYPMLILATDTDKTFTPYAMTNRELTEKIVLREHTYTGTSDANGVVVASTVPHRPIVYCYGAPTGGGNVFVDARPGGGGIAFYCHNNGAKVASTEITIHYFDYQD